MSAEANVAESSIPVDLFNPGQVFACIGFAEAADVLLGDVEGFFDWTKRDTVRFRLRACGDENPVDRVLRFLSEATVIAEAPYGSENIDDWLPTWGRKPVELPKGAPYPSGDPDSAASLAVALTAGDRRVRVDYWADRSDAGSVVTGRDNAKFWGGSRGYPAAALVRDCLDEVRATGRGALSDPFALMTPQANGFNLDWRRNYVPIDAGFSLNKHKSSMTTTGFPIVEMLGAIGLTHARPRRVGFKRDLHYRYGAIGTSRESVWLPLSLLRAGLGITASAFEMRRFDMYLSWVAKEDQMRSITQVTEESET